MYESFEKLVVERRRLAKPACLGMGYGMGVRHGS